MRSKPRDRWAIVAYIRALQYSENASVTDLPAEARARVPAAGSAPLPAPARSEVHRGMEHTKAGRLEPFGRRGNVRRGACQPLRKRAHQDRERRFGRKLAIWWCDVSRDGHGRRDRDRRNRLDAHR